MYTNEFGQTIKADWVSFSVTEEQLSQLTSTVVRSIVRDSSVNGVVQTMENEEVLSVFYVAGVKPEYVDAIKEAIGVEIYEYDEESQELHFDDGYFAFGRILRIMFGESTKYSYDEDGDYIIQMSFDEYIRKSFDI